MNVCTECERLRVEVLELTQALQEGQKRIDWFRTHATLSRGLAGEQLVAATTGGALTIHTAPSDIILAQGTRVEVKSAKLSGAERKWQWNKIFGQSGSKNFDYLVLTGEAEPRFSDMYRYPGPEVIFLVPRADVIGLCGGRDKSGMLKISLTPNPKTARGCAARLFEFQVDAAELERVLEAAT